MIEYPFIVFEGIDHSGKTTVSKKIAESYRDFKWAHEPVFPSEFADKLNSDEYKEFPAKREVLFLEGRLGRQNFYNGNPVILDRHVHPGVLQGIPGGYQPRTPSPHGYPVRRRAEPAGRARVLHREPLGVPGRVLHPVR